MIKGYFKSIPLFGKDVKEVQIAVSVSNYDGKSGTIVFNVQQLAEAKKDAGASEDDDQRVVRNLYSGQHNMTAEEVKLWKDDDAVLLDIVAKEYGFERVKARANK